MPSELILVSSPDWKDYELMDTGDGAKLEAFGPYRFVRPEPQAVWRPAMPKNEWESAHMVFKADDEDNDQGWQIQKPVPDRWEMQYKNLKFWVRPTPFRHMGVFPEQAPHWDWIAEKIRGARSGPVKVLNLFGYTGLSTLASAAAGATVTHVDASKKAVTWARENQERSGLAGRPIRWIVDDALKFVKREVRRGVRYDGFILDPPKFGHGPKGELWKLEESLPSLLQECRSLLTKSPLFVVLTVYALRISSLSLLNALSEMLSGHRGGLTAGEAVLIDRSAGRTLSAAIFARWSAG